MSIEDLNTEDPSTAAQVTEDDVSLLMSEESVNEEPQRDAASPEEPTPPKAPPIQEEPSMETPETPPEPVQEVEPVPMASVAGAEAAEVPVPEVDELAQARQQVEVLRSELERVSGAALQNIQQQAPQPPQQPVQQQEYEWIKGEEEFQAFGTDNKKTNEILSRVHNAAREEAVQVVLQNIPRYVAPMMARFVGLNNAIQSFWGRNQDLRPYEKYVSSVSVEVEQEHADWVNNGEFGRVFDEAATRVRTRIPHMGGSALQGAQMQAPVQQVQRVVPVPTVMTRPSTRAVAVQKDEAEREFEMMDALNV